MPDSKSGELAGKTTLVIGGTRGIGRGVAERFAEEGATSVFLGRDRAVGAAVAAAIQAAGGYAEYMHCDVTQLPGLRRAIARTMEHHGRLDVLVNSAGTNIGHSLFDATEDEYSRLFDLNVRAVFFAMKWGAEAMAAGGGGSIINITSSAATRGYRERTLYCGTKAAVLLMSKAAALDAAVHDIRINCISPGTVDTDLLRSLHLAGDGDQDERIAAFGAELTPLGRVGTIRDIAAAALYLASDGACWVTGAELNVDGGVAI